MKTNIIGKDDGFGNKVSGISKEVFDKIYADFGSVEIGDMIYLHNKEGCRIATYKVTK